MDSNETLISRFAAYKKEGLVSPFEFGMISQCLLGGNAPPEWIVKLDKACSMAKAGSISQDDFRNIKAGIFQNADRAASTQGAQGGAPIQHGADAMRRAESAALVRNCAIAACIIGLIPLPVADAPFLIITQFIMLKKLCAKYGRSPGASLILIILAAVLGPLVFDALAKIIPVAGSIFGCLVAGGFTWFIGRKVLGILESGRDFTFENFMSSPVRD